MRDLSEEQLSLLSSLDKDNDTVAKELKEKWSSGENSTEFKSSNGFYVVAVFISGRWKVYVTDLQIKKTKVYFG